MKRQWYVGVLLLLACFGANSQQWQWVKPYGRGYWSSPQIATDAAGNIFLAGTFADSVRFDQLTIRASHDSTLFVAKLRPNGIPIWLKKRQGFLADAISIDMTSSACYLAITDSAPTYYPSVKHLVKFDSAGNKIWDQIIYGAWGEPRNIQEIRSDSSGNIFLKGNFSDTLTINGASIYSNNLLLSFFAKVSENGNVAWLKAFPYNDALGNNTVVVANGKIIMFRGDSLLTLDTSGNVLSIRHMWSYSSYYPHWFPSVSVNPAGYLYAGIGIDQTVNLGPYVFSDVAPCTQFWGGCGDIVSFKMTQAGQVTWAEHLYSYATDRPAATLATQNGFFHVVGTSEQELHVGDSTFGGQNTLLGAIFIASFDQNNSLYRVNGVKGGNSWVGNCAVHQNNICMVGGIDSGPVSFDSDTIRNYVGAFVAKYQVDPAMTGLSEFNQKQIQIYPNPANDAVNISCAERSRLIIYNTEGKKALEKDLTSGEFQIEMKLFPPGLYFFEISTTSTRFTRKIIKD